MTLFGRKPKTYGEMIADPAFVYQIGRLVGAAEMSSRLLADSSDPAAQSIGSALGTATEWFFRSDPNLSNPPVRPAAPAPPTTVVRPPRPGDTMKP
jgi:hypothetical protein